MQGTHLEAALLVSLLAGVVPALTGRPRAHLAGGAIHRHLHRRSISDFDVLLSAQNTRAGRLGIRQCVSAGARLAFLLLDG